MTHKLHLGTANSSRNNGLALTAADQEESECDEEKLLSWFEDSTSFLGTADTPIKETIKKEDLPILNPTLNATNVEVLITSSEIALCGKTKRARKRQGKQEDYQPKEILIKPTFAKP